MSDDKPINPNHERGECSNTDSLSEMPLWAIQMRLAERLAALEKAPQQPPARPHPRCLPVQVTDADDPPSVYDFAAEWRDKRDAAIRRAEKAERERDAAKKECTDAVAMLDRANRRAADNQAAAEHWAGMCGLIGLGSAATHHDAWAILRNCETNAVGVVAAERDALAARVRKLYFIIDGLRATQADLERRLAESDATRPKPPSCPRCSKPQWISAYGTCPCGYYWPKEATT